MRSACNNGFKKKTAREWFIHSMLLAGDLFFKQKMMRRLSFLREAQWWDIERLQKERDRQLKKLIRIAYKEVPFYRLLMDSVGVRPDNVNTVGDLKKIPVVDKQKLRACYPYETTRATGQRHYEVASSGSTGTNFRVKEDRETAGWYRASFLLILEWAGWRIGEAHLQTGMNLERSLDRILKDYLLRCHYFSAFNLGDGELDRALEILEKDRIQHLWGYPGSIYFLAQHARSKGWNVPMKSIVTWGDNLYPGYRKVIESTFATKVHDAYGCGEGMWISAQCGDGDAYHVLTLDVITEYLDSAGLPVPPGELGNLIITRLHPGPMPLIRYQVGDIGISGGKGSCACGRGFEIMDSIMGRETDVVITPSGRRLIVHFFTGILEYFDEVKSFQVTQDSVEEVRLKIVPGATFSSKTVSDIRERLSQNGADLKICIETVDDIPATPSGKRRFVISSIWKSSGSNPGLCTDKQ